MLIFLLCILIFKILSWLPSRSILHGSHTIWVPGSDVENALMSAFKPPQVRGRLCWPHPHPFPRQPGSGMDTEQAGRKSTQNNSGRRPSTNVQKPVSFMWERTSYKMYQRLYFIDNSKNHIDMAKKNIKSAMFL